MLSHQVVEIFEEFTEYFAVFGIRTYDGLDATNKVCSGCNKILPYTNHEALKACSNEANMLVQHHPTLLDVTCWPRLNTMLDNVGRCWLEFKLSSNIVQHCWPNMLHDVGFVSVSDVELFMR